MKTLVLIITAMTLSAGVALAQTPAVPTASSVVTNVEHWTAKQWNAAKVGWAKDKAKWADCQHQSAEQKLTGRKSWSLLYTCMST
jgi:hypothetical protein